MRRKKVKRHKTSTGKQNGWSVLTKLIFVFILVIGMLTLFLAANSNPNRSSSGHIASNDARNSLQLNTFLPATPTPTSTPSSICNNIDNGHSSDPNVCTCPAYFVHCVNGECVDIDLSKSGMKYRDGHIITCADTHPPAFPPGNWCQQPIGDPNAWNCLDKPVVYLYPTHPMYINVSVKTTGKIVVSDPLYPENGWQGVHAEPSGRLTYQGKNYSELFYETNVNNFKKPVTGMTLDSKNLGNELDAVITKLGLIGPEKEEFLSYWVPRLKNLNSPYIFFSLISTSEKAKIDRVEISPKPDTMIDFLAYFKPLSNPYQGPILTLPETPSRQGFTAVEWGGTIDN